MKNIKRKLLLMRASLEAILVLYISSFGWKKEKTLNFEQPRVISQEVDVVDSIFEDFEIESQKISFEERERQRREREIQKGREEIALLFKNPKFIVALLSRRSDVVALIVEQYHIEGKITDNTIVALLTSSLVKFNEDEKNKLTSLINTPVGFGSFGLV
jgi:hypothetical protein